MAGPSVATVKRLFAVSGNRCAFPGCALPLVDEASGKVTGRICHIRARSLDGRRHDPEQSEKERHGFANLVLMCPMHHDVIDDDAETYTVERLLEIKARHEARYAGGAEPSDAIVRQFLLQFKVQVGGDFMHIGDKVDTKIVYEAGAAAATSLHQLPPPPGDFTGREEELAALCRAIEQGGATISGLRGMGGIGKTVLALKLAGQITPRYPDAQIYLDLKGTGPTPLTPGEAMAHVVRAYRPTERLPESEAELCGLYRSVLHGQRALLLMDNAAGAAQVEPLIPPPSCLLLVTSRQRFALPGMWPINLDTLPPPDARNFLLRIAGRIGDCADEMARLCGYLPLALRLAGSALARQEDLRPVEYLRRLEDRQTRLGLVEASLSLSYDLLGEGLQRRWALLAVFPGTFEQGGAAAVWGLEADRAQDGLSELLCYSLVEWDPEAERYRLHDLARVFAGSRLGGAERASGRERHAVYYQTVCGAADEFYARGGEWLLRGLGLFDLEWDNVEAGHRWAEENAAGNRRALELCDDYPAGCASILSMRQHPRQRIAWLETALTAARRLDRRQAEGSHLGNLGLAYAALGEVRRAIEYHEQALTVAREIGDRRGEGAILGSLGIAYYALGEVRQAIEYYEQALTIAREIGDRHNEAIHCWNLGLLYEDSDSARAAELMQVCVDYEREIGHPDAEARAEHVQGLLDELAGASAT